MNHIAEDGYQYAQYAAAAYLEPHLIRAELRARGLLDPGDEIINLTETTEDIEAFAHICKARGEMVVFVRGTEPASPADWLRDFSVLPARWHGYVGHRGMQEGAQEVLIGMIPIIGCYKGRVVLTGHSLGGGVCVWLQIALDGRADSVHTFGSPRVLGAKSAKLFDTAGLANVHYRWVNGSDKVPRLLWWAYRHVGRLLLIHPNKKLLQTDAAREAARSMRWRSIRSFGRRGFERHRIADYVSKLAGLSFMSRH